MDARAKQRLTGAIILVAVFVLLVPELLTGPRSSDTLVPAQPEEGLSRYTIELDGHSPSQATGVGNSPPAAPATELAAPGDVAMPEVPVPETEVPAPNVPSKSKSIVAPVDSNSSTEAAPIGTAESKATPAPAAVAPVAPASANAAPMPPASAPRPDAAATQPPVQRVGSPQERGSFAVQLGSFGSRENADRLVREMTAKGFAAFLAPPITTGGRELFRVRVGPTRDRASAEALATQLKRVGQSGSVVPIS
jgi:DedD protein